jgi:hypothetical protein
LLLSEGKEFQLSPQEDVRHCAVSPDGHWVATGSHGALKGPGAKDRRWATRQAEAPSRPMERSWPWKMYRAWSDWSCQIRARKSLA